MVKSSSSTKASVRLLKPRDGDLKHIGMEPEWRLQPEATARTSQLMRAFNWYNYSFGRKDAKEFVIDYLERNDRKADAKKLKSIHESKFRLTAGWLARMATVGLELNEHEALSLNSEISALSLLKQEIKVEDKKDVQPKQNIQDHLRAKAEECAGELEGLFDEFCSAEEIKLNLNNHKPMSIIRGMNIQPTHIGVVRDAFQRKLVEFSEVLAGEDSQLVEGYSHWSKNELKQVIKFCELVVSDCDSYVQVKKSERKPRAKKKQTPEQIVRKLKYLQDFPELKLRSEPAAKLAECTEFYTYDTVKRKLQHYVADSHVGSMTVKNSSIIGFDPTQSVAKTLRKPAEQLKALFQSGKPGARKYFKDIKATEVKLTGRFNENLIILKVW